MSAKTVDKYNRWRNVTVGFRMSPQEAEELNVKVALSGLSKQDYIIGCLLNHEIRVVCGKKVAKQMEMYLEAILEELQLQEETGIADEELLTPLIHILDILKRDDEGE